MSQNAFFAPNAESVPALEAYMDTLRASGDSLARALMCWQQVFPRAGGQPVFDRLDADIAHAMMSINAVKGVEIGDGFETVTQKAASMAMC